MSQLPKGWVGCKLGNVVDYGKTVKADMTNIDDETWVLELEDLEKDSSKILQRVSFGERKPKSAKNAFKTGDVLYGKLRPYLNKIVVAHEDGICTSEIIPLKVPTGLLDNRFLFYWLKGRVFGDYVNAVSYGVNMPRLGTKDGLNAPMVLAPFAEQTRIVEKLDEVLAQVDTIKARLDGIPAILKRFRQSVLAAAVSGKLTEEWRGNAEYSDSKNQLVPSTWEVRAAKDICVKVQSGSTPRNDPFNQNGTIPFLKVYNIVNQKIDFDYKPQFITSETHSETLKRSVAYPGDVLMNIVGPPLGKVAILTDQYPEWNLNQAITLFRANEEILLNKYLYFVLCEGELVRAVMPETKGSVGQVNISLSQCRDSLIPLPPLEEQKEIVRLVDQYFAFADTIEAQVKKAQARVDKLTQSILAKAFRGELVPQDPNDEPADKLLERIAAARKEAEALAKAAEKAGRKRAKA